MIDLLSEFIDIQDFATYLEHKKICSELCASLLYENDDNEIRLEYEKHRIAKLEIMEKYQSQIVTKICEYDSFFLTLKNPTFKDLKKLMKFHKIKTNLRNEISLCLKNNEMFNRTKHLNFCEDLRVLKSYIKYSLINHETYIFFKIMSSQLGQEILKKMNLNENCVSTWLIACYQTPDYNIFFQDAVIKFWQKKFTRNFDAFHLDQLMKNIKFLKSEEEIQIYIKIFTLKS